MKEVLSKNLDDTARIARDIAGTIQKGDIVAFNGELGAGKTAIIKEICKALGVKDLVTSPTYTLMNIYSGSFPVLHVDCYRMRSSAEAEMLGLDDYFNKEYVMLIEWAEKIKPILPPATTYVNMSHVSDQPKWRIIVISDS